jgi:cell division protein FtsL
MQEEYMQMPILENQNQAVSNPGSVPAETQKKGWRKTLAKVEKVFFTIVVLFIAYGIGVSIRAQKAQHQMQEQLQILPELTQRVNLNALSKSREASDNYQDLLNKTKFKDITFNEKREMFLTFSDSEKLNGILQNVQLKFSPLTNVDHQIVSWTCSVSPDQDNADELQKYCVKSLKEDLKQ